MNRRLHVYDGNFPLPFPWKLLIQLGYSFNESYRFVFLCKKSGTFNAEVPHSSKFESSFCLLVCSHFFLFSRRIQMQCLRIWRNLEWMKSRSAFSSDTRTPIITDAFSRHLFQLRLNTIKEKRSLKRRALAMWDGISDSIRSHRLTSCCPSSLKEVSTYIFAILLIYWDLSSWRSWTCA